MLVVSTEIEYVEGRKTWKQGSCVLGLATYAASPLKSEVVYSCHHPAIRVPQFDSLFRARSNSSVGESA